MSLTRQKLDEAEFFLSKIESLTRDRPRDRPESKYYLSAFVSAARSVTWIMRYEYARVVGWEQWYDSTAPNGEDFDLLRKFNELRVRSEKKRPLDPSFVPLILPYPPREQEVPSALGGSKRLISIVTIRPVPSEDTPVVVEGADCVWLWEIDAFEGNDLVQMCHHYFENLSDLLHRCEARFGKSPLVS
jgi:hypothetical protein